jgi:acylphosphatase
VGSAALSDADRRRPHPASEAAAGGVEHVRRRVVVHGHVHAVGFRATCAARADEAHVAGWVRNLADGSVEAVFEGDPPHVASLVEWCRFGPRLARVTRVEVFSEPPEHLAGFVVH